MTDVVFDRVVFDRAATSTSPTFEEVVAQRLSRRQAMKALLVVGGAAAGGAGLAPSVAEAAPGDDLNFTAIPSKHTTDDVLVATGFTHDLLISWGDPVVPGAPAFTLGGVTAASQLLQHGYNCDFTAYTPLPVGSTTADDGLLWVNHEYTEAERMFPDFVSGTRTDAQIDIEIAAHGASVIRVSRNAAGVWGYDPGSSFNRRITGFTPIPFAGPAAGHAWLQTADDPGGTTAVGMFNNCGGGYTAWGTVLTAEENFNQYFANRPLLPGEAPTGTVPATGPSADPKANNHYRFGLPKGASDRLWETRYPRFSVATTPNEPFRFGWIVEVDPYNASDVPIKHTALGRMKHEAAAGALSTAGHWVSYLGDDERFEFTYKYVSTGVYDPTPANRLNNRALLDNGTLYAAKFNNDGTGQWLPLTFGTGALVAPAFTDQGDALIRAREAGTAVAATPMDRPEDIEVNPLTKKVYIACTNNSQRGTTGNLAQYPTPTPRPGLNAQAPRADSTPGPTGNPTGHIIEITETGNDNAALTFTWEIFMLCGDPTADLNPAYVLGSTDVPRSQTYFAGFDRTQVSKIGAPDNLAFDTQGNLWIATDGMPASFTGAPNDSILGVPTAGAFRGKLKSLMSGPKGCEVASLTLNTDDTAIFAAIQHPGELGTIPSPISTWPNAAADGVARPTVIVVHRLDSTSIPSGPEGPDPVVPEFKAPAALLATGAAVAGVIAFRRRQSTQGAPG